MHSFPASVCASLFATGALHWMETMKIRRQLGDKMSIMHNGFFALQKGFFLNVLAGSLAWIITMTLKTSLQKSLSYTLSLFLAIAITTAMTNWIWVFKAHQQNSQHNESFVFQYDWIYRGLGYSLLLNIMYGGIQFSMYDTLIEYYESAIFSAALSKLFAIILTYNMQHRRLGCQLKKATYYAGLRWAVSRSLLHNILVFQL